MQTEFDDVDVFKCIGRAVMSHFSLVSADLVRGQHMSCAMPVSPCVLQHVKSVSKEAGRDRKLDSIYSTRSRTFNTYWHNYLQTAEISGVFSSGLGDMMS